MAKDSLLKASTHKQGLEKTPGKSDNWVERSGAGGKGGQLPAYIQHIALAIRKKQGMDTSRAIAIAVGTVKRWARGGGNVDANTRAAASKALAEWEAMRAKSKIRESADVPALDDLDDEGVLAAMAEVHEVLGLEVDLGVMESARTRSGEERAEKEKGRGGRDEEFEKKHPRGRGGKWTLGKGATGDEVRAVQRRVGAKADGSFGEQTRQAILRFQRAHGLQADGVVGAQTIAAMRGDRNARDVKPGAASGEDRKWLRDRTDRLRESVECPLALEVELGDALLEAGSDESVLGLILDDDMRLAAATGGLHIVESLALAVPGQDLAIVEATGNADPLFNADGTINMVLIRPCHGRGTGSRIYTQEMLRENAGVFTGWPMFDNHESPQAKRARQGIPRPPSDLAGQILESWWDPAYATPEDAAMGFDPGAVIGRCMLTEDMEKLVRRLPLAIKTSVNATATGMRPASRNGRRGALVEGIVNDPETSSVDLVTTAGAGGRVAAILESLSVG